jgi:iron-sulfur cluster assembly protein
MITITTEGAKRVTEFLESRGSGIGIRIAITTTGCSGYAYNLEFADMINEGDTVSQSNGITIVTDKKAHAMVNGTEIEFIKDGLSEGFQFNNPNEKAQCGCGESFTL